VLRKLTEGNIIELDSNDRLLVPAEQKHVLAKAKEIVLQSTGKFIELWSRETYEKMNQSSGDYAAKAEMLLGTMPVKDGM
jgi:DNA-binding transcriptional regulator/RsmH inhibitor MraZ